MRLVHLEIEVTSVFTMFKPLTQGSRVLSSIEHQENIIDTWIPLFDALAGVRDLAQHHQSEPISGAEASSLLWRDLPADAYHSDRDALSCSLLKPLLTSPAHFQAGLVALPKTSTAKDFGSLVHLLLLQPHLAGQELAVFPGIGNSRDPEFKAFLAANSYRLAVDEPSFAQARRLASKLAESPYKRRPLGRFIEESICEGSIYFTEPVTGLRLRIRLDAYHPDISFDVKTTRHSTPAAFARDAVELGYDLQAFMYGLGRRLYEGAPTAPFVFIAAETAQPHSIGIFEAGNSFLENGQAKFESCLAAFKACSETADWPDLSCSETLDIAPWQQFTPLGQWRSALTCAD